MCCVRFSPAVNITCPPKKGERQADCCRVRDTLCAHAKLCVMCLYVLVSSLLSWTFLLWKVPYMLVFVCVCVWVCLCICVHICLWMSFVSCVCVYMVLIRVCCFWVVVWSVSIIEDASHQCLVLLLSAVKASRNTSSLLLWMWYRTSNGSRCSVLFCYLFTQSWAHEFFISNTQQLYLFHIIFICSMLSETNPISLILMNYSEIECGMLCHVETVWKWLKLKCSVTFTWRHCMCIHGYISILRISWERVCLLSPQIIQMMIFLLSVL